jgi:hypothetical protein
MYEKWKLGALNHGPRGVTFWNDISLLKTNQQLLQLNRNTLIALNLKVKYRQFTQG